MTQTPLLPTQLSDILCVQNDVPLWWTSWSAVPALWWGSGWGPGPLFGRWGPSASQTWGSRRRLSYHCLSGPWPRCLYHPGWLGPSTTQESVGVRATSEYMVGVISNRCLLWCAEERWADLSLDWSRDFVSFLHDPFIDRITETWNQRECCSTHALSMGCKTTFQP